MCVAKEVNKGLKTQLISKFDRYFNAQHVTENILFSNMPR